MRAEILSIGSELTGGSTVNTNAPFLAQRLAACGITCQRHVTVADDRALIRAAICEALGRCELLLTTGGLGPTFDDLTMEVIADATGCPLTPHADVARTIRRFYTRRHRRLQRAALRQAWLPRGGEALPNALGTAPGLWLALPAPIIVSLPGVPNEMRAIFEASIVPRLRRLMQGQVIESRTIRTAGIVELSIQRTLERLGVPTGIEVGLYPNLRMVDVRLTMRGTTRPTVRATLARFAVRLTRALGVNVYGEGQTTLERALGALFIAQRQTVAVAESCTGGLISDRLTNAPGSSRYFGGAAVAYDNVVKVSTLGVPTALLRRYGAVSAQVAKAMAAGVRRWAGTDVGISATGIAGPDGGTASKPVGLVYIALARATRTSVQRCRFFGDRLTIKMQAAQFALDWLRRDALAASHRRSRR